MGARVRDFGGEQASKRLFPASTARHWLPGTNSPTSDAHHRSELCAEAGGREIGEGGKSSGCSTTFRTSRLHLHGHWHRLPASWSFAAACQRLHPAAM